MHCDGVDTGSVGGGCASRQAGHVQDRDDLADAVAITNREASANAADIVSEECVVTTLSPDGAGQLLVYGDLPKQFIQSVILRGIDLAIADTLKQQGLANQMLASMSWPNGKDGKQTLKMDAGVVSMSFRSINTNFKWPDDPNAPPREKVPVESTITSNT